MDKVFDPEKFAKQLRMMAEAVEEQMPSATSPTNRLLLNISANQFRAIADCVEEASV